MSEIQPEPQPESQSQPEPRPAAQGSLRQRLYRIPVLGALVYVIAPPRTNRSVTRRVVSGTCGVVAILGLGMVAYPVAHQWYPGFFRIPVEKAIEWSNVFSDLQTNKIQKRLEGDFASDDIASKLRSGTLAEGDPMTRIEIPKIGVDTIIVEGTSTSALKAGAGHYVNTPLPGEAGNVAVAGHRTTYGRPFNRVDELRTGDLVVLTTPVGKFTYALSRDPWITAPTDLSVIGQGAEHELTLTSCHPKGSARQRIIVRAKLVKREPYQLGGQSVKV